MKSHISVKKKTFEQIRQEWIDIQTLNPQIRYKRLKTLAFDICNSYNKKCNDLAELDFYIKTLQQILKQHRLPAFAKMQTKLFMSWLKLTGNDKIEVQYQTLGKISVVGGFFAIADAAYLNEVLLVETGGYETKDFLSLINHKKCFMVSLTTDDFLLKVELRVQNSLLPVINEKELKYVQGASEFAIIHLPTGNLVLADPYEFQNNEDHISAKVEPGNYKVSVYPIFRQDEFKRFIVVLCKTDRGSPNNFTEIYESLAP